MEIARTGMARYSDLRLQDRIFMTAYRFRTAQWEPGSRLGRPLSRCRIALVTTAAFYEPGQEPFDKALRGGDFSSRTIRTETDLDSLRIGHRSAAFDHRGVETDKNLALPIDRLRELERAGAIGSLNHRHFSFMGSITAPGRLVRQSAPEVAARLTEDGVDAVFLTPV